MNWYGSGPIRPRHIGGVEADRRKKELRMARIAVIGAGVVGVATAYMLGRQGHEVILVDRAGGPAEGTSRANGAQLSYAYGDALGSPSLLSHMPAILLGRDPAYRARMQADPEYFLWGLRFLANCAPGRFIANTRALLEMGQNTRALLGDLLRDFDVSFDYAVSGKMILYGTAAGVAGTAPMRALKHSMGFTQQVLTRQEATSLEPALDLYPDEIAGVVYTADDAAARPDMFCARLLPLLQARHGLKTVFGHEVLAVASRNGQVTGLTFRTRDPLECDRVVVATGLAEAFLPWADRCYGGVWPVQGYSITADATAAAMRVSITDVKRKIVFARLGDQVRAAGLADIGRYRFRFDADRFDTFRRGAVEAFGPAFRHGPEDAVHPWSGGRPCTPSSRPVIRPGSLKGLYLNLGHGTLGWTLCLGSAHRLLEVMEGAET
jgi:D-amino-acid dehydrogenase